MEIIIKNQSPIQPVAGGHKVGAVLGEADGADVEGHLVGCHPHTVPPVPDVDHHVVLGPDLDRESESSRLNSPPLTEMTNLLSGEKETLPTPNLWPVSVTCLICSFVIRGGIYFSKTFFKFGMYLLK